MRLQVKLRHSQNHIQVYLCAWSCCFLKFALVADGLIMPITRALPAGISVEKFVDPLLGVLPFLGTMARGADNARHALHTPNC